MGGLRAVSIIAAKDIRQRLRDRSLLVLGVVAPIALAAIVSAALGSGDFGFSPTFAVADRDRGALPREFVARALEDGEMARVATVRHVAGDAAIRQAIIDGHADAGFAFPRGFSAAARAGTGRFTAYADGGSPIMREVAVSLARAFARSVDGVRLAVATAVAEGADPAAAEREARAAEPPMVVHARTTQGTDLKPASYIAPAMAILFLFLAMSLGARSLIGERETGTLGRLLASPAPRWSVLLGKSASTFLVGIASMATVVVVTARLLGSDWGAAPGVALVVVAIVTAALGITMLLVSLARTQEQATTYTQIVTFVFALLGGNFTAGARVPDALRRLSLLTPNGWTLRALSDLAVGASTRAVLPATGVVFAFGAVAAALAIARANRLVGP
jgi:ABC-2 type transport system permease protein